MNPKTTVVINSTDFEDSKYLADSLVSRGGDFRIIFLTAAELGLSGEIRIDHPFSAESVRKIAELSDEDFICWITDDSAAPRQEMAESFISAARVGHAVFIYSDYEIRMSPVPKTKPVLDYQQGSVRENFDFGKVLFFGGDAFRHAAAQISNSKYSGLYDLRLRLSELGEFVRIPRPLYSVLPYDLRKSGERQFDYVDPANSSAQKEYEQLFTEYLRRIGAYLPPVKKSISFSGNFPFEASVIIPVKNRVGTIEEAVNSALAQNTDFPFNIIVVDNHSTDGTAEVLRRISENDSRIVRIIPDRTDLGIGGCWDLGINSNHCGRFAVQLDSDDLYSSSETLAKIVQKFYVEKCAMVVGSYKLVNFEMEELPPGVIDHREWTAENGHNNLLRVNGLGAPRAFFTPVLKEIGIPNVSYGEDYFLGLTISAKYKIGRIYEPLYLCRRWKGNSDADLTWEKENTFNFYKDGLRSAEISRRMNLQNG